MSTAWVMYVKNNDQAVRGYLFAKQLRDTNTQHKIHLLYSPRVSERIAQEMRSLFDDGTLVDVLDHSDPDNLPLIERPDLVAHFSKLYCFKLVQYSKAVYLDPYCGTIKNSDELFSRPVFSAAPDVAWPDMFDTGVFVYSPNLETYRALVDLAVKHEPFPNGDQGILNAYFHTWRTLPEANRLPLMYNMKSIGYHPHFAEVKIHNLSNSWQKPWIVYQHHEGFEKSFKFKQSTLKMLYSSLNNGSGDFDSDDESELDEKKEHEQAKKILCHDMQFSEECGINMHPQASANVDIDRFADSFVKQGPSKSVERRLKNIGSSDQSLLSELKARAEKLCQRMNK